MLSAILVEDEMLARERLKVLLSNCSVHILAEFDYAQEALKWLSNHTVDIAFVDIGLPEMNGLEFVETLKRTAKNTPHIIFSTAHEEYALKAFDLSAVDYLLKPIKLSRLQAAIEKINAFSPAPVEDAQKEFSSFVINSRNKIINIAWQQARYLKADHKYVVLFTMDGKEYVLDKTLLYWEEILADKVIRIHRSILVLKHALEGMFRIGSEDDEHAQWYVKVLDLPDNLPISRRQLPILRKHLSGR